MRQTLSGNIRHDMPGPAFDISFRPLQRTMLTSMHAVGAEGAFTLGEIKLRTFVDLDDDACRAGACAIAAAGTGGEEIRFCQRPRRADRCRCLAAAEDT